MPFYFRIPLPGPFGYSHRIGSRRRKRPARSKTYTGTSGDGWRCQHAHRTPNAATVCGLRHDLAETEQIAAQLLEVDLDGADEATVQHYKATGERLLAKREEIQRQIRELS